MSFNDWMERRKTIRQIERDSYHNEKVKVDIDRFEQAKIKAAERGRMNAHSSGFEGIKKTGVNIAKTVDALSKDVNEKKKKGGHLIFGNAFDIKEDHYRFP